MEGAERSAILPQLELVSAMGDGAVACPRKSIEIAELVPDGLCIVLTVGSLLIRPVCENYGNPNTWWVSGITIIDERFWSISGGVQFGNDIPRNGENILERWWWVGLAGRKFRSGRYDRVSGAVEF